MNPTILSGAYLHDHVVGSSRARKTHAFHCIIPMGVVMCWSIEAPGQTCDAGGAALRIETGCRRRGNSRGPFATEVAVSLS